MSNRNFAIACIVVIGVASALLYANRRGWLARLPIAEVAERDPAVGESSQGVESKSGRSRLGQSERAIALGVSDDELIEVGGVMRPERDLGYTNEGDAHSEVAYQPWPHPGRAKSVSADSNEQVAGLIRELAMKNGPAAAKSALFAPEAFDLPTYLTDPNAYLEKIRPGRVFDPAQEGTRVTRLASDTQRYQKVIQGETVWLRIKAEPEMPVSFSTTQVGKFENQLPAITVAADASGVASVQFTPGSGSLGLNDILVASPVHTGQLRFLVDVLLPGAAN